MNKNKHDHKLTNTCHAVSKAKPSNKGKIKGNFSLIGPIFEGRLPFSKEDYLSFAKVIANSYNEFITHLGIKFGTKHYKNIVLYCNCLLEGREAKPVDRVSLGTKDRWPNCFGKLRPIWHLFSDTEDKTTKLECLRLLNTLFNLYKEVEDFKELDIEGITQSFKLDKKLEEEFTSFLASRVQTVDPKALLKDPRLFFGPGRGPNGKPKRESLAMEAYGMVYSKLYTHFKMYCESTGNSAFLNYLEHIAQEVKNGYDVKPETLKHQKAIKLRKITSVPDAGNKSRVIAISDFWTQSLLTSLEADQIKYLNREFHDKSAFRSHSEGWNRVLPLLDDDWVSVDATAWTDNFPARLQYLYLKQRYGQQLAQAWLELVVKCRWHVGNTDVTIKYGKGQGMGTKGSFIIASVTDHLFLEFILNKVYGHIPPYMKVGDDLIVKDPKRALLEWYPKIGVPVNILKSKMKTPNGHFAEFVSRSSWDGLDYSRISARLMARARKQPYILLVLYKHIIERMSDVKPDLLNRIIESMNLRDQDIRKLKVLMDIFQTFTGEIIIEDFGDVELASKCRKYQVLSALMQDLDDKYGEFTVDKDKHLYEAPELERISSRLAELDSPYLGYLELGMTPAAIERHYYYVDHQLGENSEIWKFPNDMFVDEFDEMDYQDAGKPGSGVPFETDSSHEFCNTEYSKYILNELATLTQLTEEVRNFPNVGLLSELNLPVFLEIFRSLSRAYKSTELLPDMCEVEFPMCMALSSNPFWIRIEDPSEGSTE